MIVIACGFGYGLNLARVARPAALLASRSSYVESALANGASGWRVLISHVMPNILPVLAVQLSLSAGTAVLAESGSLISVSVCRPVCRAGAFSGHFGQTHQRVPINRGVARPDRHGCGCGAEYFW